MSSKLKIKYLMVDRKQLELSKSKTQSLDLIKQKMKRLLDDKIHGISFSPYIRNQNPAQFDWISPEQIASRLAVIQPYVQWIRTFSCTLGNEGIAPIAKKQGLKTLVGAWIGDDLEMNEAELDNVIRIAKEGHADIVAIGNEVLLREDIPVELLLSLFAPFQRSGSQRSRGIRRCLLHVRQRTRFVGKRRCHFSELLSVLGTLRS
ncbi:MAG: hypothetical protein MZU97_23550 [Bacillus subtilis]|nr:hypothetical protein [Bacillus subtilis]